jgi:hypothetical protein
MIATRAVKSQYSESEAAEALGVSVDRLRQLIRDHIVQTDDELTSVSSAVFQPSDLLVLRLLATRKLVAEQVR